MEFESTIPQIKGIPKEEGSTVLTLKASDP